MTRISSATKHHVELCGWHYNGIWFSSCSFHSTACWHHLLVVNSLSKGTSGKVHVFFCILLYIIACTSLTCSPAHILWWKCYSSAFQHSPHSVCAYLSIHHYCYQILVNRCSSSLVYWCGGGPCQSLLRLMWSVSQFGCCMLSCL